MPPLHSEPSRSAQRQKPISLLERSELPPPPYRPSYEEVERRLTAKRRGRFSSADARNAAPMQKAFLVDDETRLHNERLARRVAESGDIAGLLPILESALSQDPETAPAQVGHLLQEVRRHDPEKADVLERQLPRREDSRAAADSRSVRSRAELIPPGGPKREPLNEAIQGFIDFSKTEGLYDYLPSHARETLNFALDLATILPGPSKAFVVAEFATMIAPAIEHVLKGDYDAAAETATDAIIYLPFAILAGRRGGKLAVKTSRYIRGGSDLPSPTPLVAGAGITQLADDDFAGRLATPMGRYDVLEPQPSGPPPLEPLPPEDRIPHREELIPPDLDDLLTQIPPTPGFTLADKDDIVEIFPDQREEIPPILIVESYPGNPHTVDGNKVVKEFMESLIQELGLRSRIVFRKYETYLPNWRTKGNNGSNATDFSFVDEETGCTIHVNTVDTLKNQISPDSREYEAELRILDNKEICDMLVLIPKAKANQIYNLEALRAYLEPIILELPTRVPEKKSDNFSPNPMDSHNIPVKPIPGKF